MNRITSLYYIFKSEFIKDYAEIKYYGFNFAIGFINTSILCYILIEGFYQPGSNFTDFLIKFFIWYVGRDLISDMTEALIYEKNQGTLEYIYLNISKLELFLFVKSISTFIWSVGFYLVVATILVFANFVDDKTMTYNISIEDSILIFNALIACIGFGYFFSGLSLVLRKVGAFVGVFGYLLLFSQLVDVKSNFYTILSFIPGAWYRLGYGIEYTFIYAIISLVLGLISFSVCLRLSLKGGYFWRN